MGAARTVPCHCTPLLPLAQVGSCSRTLPCGRAPVRSAVPNGLPVVPGCPWSRASSGSVVPAIAAHRSPRVWRLPGCCRVPAPQRLGPGVGREGGRINEFPKRGGPGEGRVRPGTGKSPGGGAQRAERCRPPRERGPMRSPGSSHPAPPPAVSETPPTSLGTPHPAPHLGGGHRGGVGAAGGSTQTPALAVSALAGSPAEGVGFGVTSPCDLGDTRPPGSSAVSSHVCGDRQRFGGLAAAGSSKPGQGGLAGAPMGKGRAALPEREDAPRPHRGPPQPQHPPGAQR